MPQNSYFEGNIRISFLNPLCAFLHAGVLFFIPKEKKGNHHHICLSMLNRQISFCHGFTQLETNLTSLLYHKEDLWIYKFNHWYWMITWGGPREEQIIFASGYEGRILYTAVFCFNKIHLCSSFQWFCGLFSSAETGIRRHKIPDQKLWNRLCKNLWSDFIG